MPNLASLILLVALVSPPGGLSSPVPSPPPGVPLKTIVTVRSSPYCDALKDHFNAAFVPMLANNVTFAGIGTQLDDIGAAFSKPTYAQDFAKERSALIKRVGTLVDSLGPMQDQIDLLRAASAATRDPAAARELGTAASQLQKAHDEQRQLTIDLQGFVQAMMEYDRPDEHALGGMDPSEIGMPADERNIKSYLRYDGRRDVMFAAENSAVDTAYDIALNRCSE